MSINTKNKQFFNFIYISSIIGIFTFFQYPAYADLPKSLSFVNSGSCPYGWRHLDFFAVNYNRNKLLDKMSKWQITQIGEGNVILGRGYGGVVKQGKAGTSWCLQSGDQYIPYATQPLPYIDRTQLITVTQSDPNLVATCPVPDGYRILNVSEANNFLPSIIKQIPDNYVANISDGYGVYGRSYNNGKGKVAKISRTDRVLCYPIDPRSNTNIVPAVPWSVEGGNIENVTFSIVSNKAHFLEPWRFFQYLLGYSWVRGDDIDQFSWGFTDDLTIKRENDGGLSVIGNGTATPPKAVIKAKNFQFIIDSDSFAHGTPISRDKELVKSITAWAYNLTNTPQQVVVETAIKESTSWSKTQTYSLGEKVSLSHSWGIPSVASTTVSAEISSSQSWASQNGGNNETTVKVQARPFVPAHSKIPITISVYKANVTFPYSFKAYATYDLYMWGYLQQNNAAIDFNKGWLMRKFAIGYYDTKNNSIPELWQLRINPSRDTQWDFTQLVNLWGYDQTKELLGQLIAPIQTTITGNMTLSSQTASDIVVGAPEAITSRFNSSKKIFSDNPDINVTPIL